MLKIKFMNTSSIVDFDKFIRTLLFFFCKNFEWRNIGNRLLSKMISITDKRYLFKMIHR